MRWIWTWKGNFLGYQDKDNLFNYKGKHIGKFYKYEIYDVNGWYIGELINGRAIKSNHKRHQRTPGFLPTNGVQYSNLINQIGYVMLAGYSDFLSVDNFNQGEAHERNY